VTDTWNSVGLAPGKRIVAAGKFVRGFGQSLYLVADSAGNMTVEQVQPGAPLTVRPITGWVGGAVVGIGRFFKSHQQGIVVDRGFTNHPYYEALLLSDTYGATLPLVSRPELAPAPRPAGIGSLSMVAVGDFNGDGNDDIIWDVDGALEVQLMEGSTRLGSPVGIAPLVFSIGGIPVTFAFAGVGDFDGDGRTDIAWVGGGAYYIMLMDGTAPKEPISGSRVRAIGPDWVVQATGDYDGDGKADLLWRSDVQGLNLITYMDGSGPLPRLLPVQAFLPSTTEFIDP
jgi:hypothetical protein